MFELGKTEDGVTISKLDYDFELDKLKIGEFTYFRKYLGMSDYLANFQSWLKRPTVALVLAISENTVVGWAMNEKWSSPSTDGRPVYVLRGIEVSPHLARKGMGKKMVYLISHILAGHIITKPVNKTAKLFFESMGFAEPASDSPVHLMDHPGYLIFEESKKDILSDDGVELFDDGIISCRLKMFPKEPAYKPVRKSVSTSETAIGHEGGINNAKEEISSKRTTGLSPGQGKTASEELDENFIFDGKFIGEQKMMSPCKCGHFLVKKYQVTGSRNGTAFICENCNNERYFLPLKKKA